MQINTKRSIVIIVIFFIAGFFLISQPTKNSTPAIKLEQTGYIKLAGQRVKVDLARTTREKAVGLSGRSELKEGEGMLFVFDQPGRYYFWMKDMNFSIDIIWLQEDPLGNLRVIYVERDVRPESYPEVYGPDVDSKYVLEVVASFSEKYNLQVGDDVELLTDSF